MADDSNKTEPTNDDGVRPARFGLKTLIAAVVLAVTTTVFALKIFGGNHPEEPAPPSPPVGTIPAAPIPPPVQPAADPTPSPPPPPSIHPLEGRHYILSAPPGNWRHAYLSWTGGLMDAGYPIATIERDDPCVWELVGIEGRRDIYRVFCRTGSEQDGANLTYTHFSKQDFPYATVEKNDPGLWKITPLSGQPDRYKIVCYDDSDWHAGELSWQGGHEAGPDYPVATVEKHDPTSWRLIPEGDPLPATAKPVTHVIIFPKKDIAAEPLEEITKWAPDIIIHLADKGDKTLKLTIDLHDGNEIVAHYAGTSFQSAAEQLHKANDPVTAFLPGSLRAGSGALIGLVADAVGDDRKLEPFPLVLPVTNSGTLAVESIRELLFEDDGFRYSDKLEKIERFQLLLDESEPADGRVFHGSDYFTYVFVNLTPAP